MLMNRVFLQLAHLGMGILSIIQSSGNLIMGQQRAVQIIKDCILRMLCKKFLYYDIEFGNNVYFMSFIDLMS